MNKLTLKGFLLGALLGLSTSVYAITISNGNFEDGTFGWNSWGGTASDIYHNGKGGVSVSNISPQWSGLHQEVHLPPEAKYATVGGWIKTKDVVGGKENWERARISIEFLDAKEKMIGGYQSALGDLQGTLDWTNDIKQYDIPQGAKKIKVVCALGNATGTAYFDDIILVLWDKSGKAIGKGFISDNAPTKVTEKDPIDATKPNHLFGGDFETIGMWNAWGGASQPWEKIAGSMGLRANNAQPGWTGADQTVIVPKGGIKAKVSGWMKTKDVIQGELDYEKARFNVEFLDAGGGLVDGKYPITSAETVGTTPWTYYEKEYNLPTGTAKIKVNCALGNVIGTAWWDNMRLTISNKDGKGLESIPFTGPMDQGQWYELPVNPKASGSHFVDWSNLLDAPAGKHGFVKTNSKGDMEFADGTPIKFWGANLVDRSLFQDYETADSTASRLAKMGCNLIRFHHADAPWSKPNLFGNDEKSTRKLDPESMDKFDYLVSALKKKGIYIYMDWLVHREFKKGDGTIGDPKELGGKQVAIFEPKLIELQKEFIKNLMTHTNKYTKIAYKDEPAIIGSEFINESTIFSTFGKDNIQGPYKKVIDDLWKKSGNKGKLSTYTHDWLPNNRGILKVKDNPENNNASIKFLADLELKYYQEMAKFARDLGIKYPLSGTNYPPPILATLKNNTSQDVIISNDYWDHPQLFRIGNDWDRVNWAPFDNRSQLRAPGSALIHTKAFAHVKNMPMMITEWNHCGWNEYILEAVPLMAAYSSLQGWDGLMQFDTDHEALGAAPMKLFTLSRAPDDVMQWIIAAPMFLNGYIKEATSEVTQAISDKEVYSGNSYTKFQEENEFLPYVTKVTKTFGGKAEGDPKKFKKYVDDKNGAYNSETGELSLLHKKGIFEIKADKIQGAVGFLKGHEFKGKNLSFKINNTHASIFAISADGKDISKSKKLYIVAAGPSKMKGFKYNRSRNGAVALGELPIVTQVVEGDLKLKLKGKTAEVRYLKSDGSLVYKKDIKLTKGFLNLKLNQKYSPVMEIIIR